MEGILRAITEGNRKFGENVRKGDVEALVSLYTTDACLLPDNSEMIKGRSAIKEFWGGAMSKLGLKDIKLMTLEIFGEGDTVAEVGRYQLKIQGEGQKAIEDSGKYIVVWKKTADGWKMHRDIWNTSLPPQ